MKNETAYTVDQQTRQGRNAAGWERTTWRVTAPDKNSARAAARVAATLAGLHVGECYTVEEV